jgi:hypothetical protein
MRYFATYFDSHYLPRALALFQSLVQRCGAFRLFALCLDECACKAVEELCLSNVSVVTLDQLEHANPELLRVKSERTKAEYYYTCGPSFLLHLLAEFPEIDLITHLDADLFFFSDPQPLFEDLEGYSVGIIEHRFGKRLEKLNRFGLYNVGWVSFRRNEEGLECLQWWSERCIEWCYDRVEGDRFADQKYLDAFPVRFKSVRVIQHPGANLAPWNVASHHITERGDQVSVDGRPLVFFHFQGFRVIASWLFDTNLGWYQTRPSPTVRRKIFGPYILELERVRICAGQARSLRDESRSKSRGFGILVRSCRLGVQVFFGLVRRAYIVVFSGNVL